MGLRSSLEFHCARVFPRSHIRRALTDAVNVEARLSNALLWYPPSFPVPYFSLSPSFIEIADDHSRSETPLPRMRISPHLNAVSSRGRAIIRNLFDRRDLSLHYRALTGRGYISVCLYAHPRWEGTRTSARPGSMIGK